MPFRTRYIALAGPAWPPNGNRASVIYSTIARAIRAPNPAQKVNVLNTLQVLVVNFDATYHHHLESQANFNTWHSQTVGALMAIPFTWRDASGTAHTSLTFGAAQKFLNLAVKDWWALSLNGTHHETRVEYLHGPLDSIVYTCTSRFRGPLASLHNPNGTLRSYVYFLTVNDYQTYQNHLSDIANHLTGALGLGNSIRRIEVEQLLWGWV